MANDGKMGDESTLGKVTLGGLILGIVLFVGHILGLLPEWPAHLVLALTMAARSWAHYKEGKEIAHIAAFIAVMEAFLFFKAITG